MSPLPRPLPANLITLAITVCHKSYDPVNHILPQIYFPPTSKVMNRTARREILWPEPR
jgi:hypothetical protein